MSLLTKASLVMTPNAIKESKVYSIIPSSGNGDLTFTRGTNASGTLNNDNLLIENSPYNLISNSNVFTSAYYNKSLVAVTSNTIASITGAVNASTLTEVAGTNSHHIHENVGSFTPVVGSSYTMSCYLKQPTSSANRYVQLPFFIAGFGSNAYVNFDLQTLSKGTIGASITSSDISLISNGWIRITATAVATATGASGFQLSLIPASTSTRTESYTVTAGSEKSVYIYGFQVVLGTVAKDYFNTTDRLNVPRLNYDTVGGCPNLLLEPLRTNLSFPSNDFSNATWIKAASSTVTFDSGILNPQNTAGSFRYNASNAVYGGILRQINTATIGQKYTVSFFVKKGNYRYVGIRFNTSTTSERYPNYDFDTDTLNKQGVTCDLSRDIYSNGWVRLNLSYTATTVSGTCDIALTAANGNTAAALSGTEFMYVFGAQYELGAYATSYIPTTSGTVTRNADQFLRSNIYTNGLITSSGGAWYLEINNNLSLTRDNSGTGLYIGDSATAPSNSFGVINTGTGRLVINKKIAGTLTSLYTTTTNTIKVVFNWNGSTMDVFVNGTKQVTATTFTSTALEFLSAYLCYVPKYIKGIYLFPAPLTDTECTNLTA